MEGLDAPAVVEDEPLVPAELPALAPEAAPLVELPAVELLLEEAPPAPADLVPVLGSLFASPLSLLLAAPLPGGPNVFGAPVASEPDPGGPKAFGGPVASDIR